MSELSLADRATIANMSSEFGATMGFFPVDEVTLQYLQLSGRSDDTVAMIESYLQANKMFVDCSNVKRWIKTSFTPGFGVVTKYLEKSGLQKYLNQLGFSIVGHGCSNCIGNSGDLDETASAAISENDIVAAAVLSGNRKTLRDLSML